MRTIDNAMEKERRRGRQAGGSPMTVRRLRRHAGNQAAGWAQSAILISKMVLSTVNLGPPRKTRTCCYSGCEVCTGLEACAKLAACQLRRYRTGFTNKRPGLNSEPPSWRLTFPAAPHVNPDVPAPVLPDRGATKDFLYFVTFLYFDQ